LFYINPVKSRVYFVLLKFHSFWDYTFCLIGLPSLQTQLSIFFYASKVLL
jgi:hypothetical protein